MAYICYKPAGSCKTCPHFRWDEDSNRMCCWARIDEKKANDKKVDDKKED